MKNYIQLIKYNFFIVVVLFYCTTLNAQAYSCYTVLKSHTGYYQALYPNNSEELERIACDIEELLTTDGPNDYIATLDGFKVFSVDYYPVLKSVTYDYSFEQLFTKEIEVLNQSQVNYFLITKFHDDNNNIIYKTHLELDWESIPFNELTEEERVGINTIVEKVMNDKISEENNIEHNYLIEKTGLEKLLYFFDQIIYGELDLRELYSTNSEVLRFDDGPDFFFASETTSRAANSSSTSNSSSGNILALTPAEELIELPENVNGNLTKVDYYPLDLVENNATVPSSWPRWPKGALRAFEIYDPIQSKYIIHVGWWMHTQSWVDKDGNLITIEPFFLGYAPSVLVNGSLFPDVNNWYKMPPSSITVGQVVTMYPKWFKDNSYDLCTISTNQVQHQVKYIYRTPNIISLNQMKKYPGRYIKDAFNFITTNEISTTNTDNSHCIKSLVDLKNKFTYPANFSLPQGSRNIPVTDFNDSAKTVLDDAGLLSNTEVQELQSTLNQMLAQTNTILNVRTIITNPDTKKDFLKEAKKLKEALPDDNILIWFHLNNVNKELQWEVIFSQRLIDDISKVSAENNIDYLLSINQAISRLVISEAIIDKVHIQLLGGVIGMVGSALKVFQIPPYVYDPQVIGYSPYYQYFFPPSILTSIVETMLNQLNNHIDNENLSILITTITLNNELSEVTFAAFCGSINGFLSELGSAFEMSGLLLGALGGNSADIERLRTIGNNIIRPELYYTLGKSVLEEHLTAADIDNPNAPKLFYLIAKDIVHVIAVVAPFTSIVKAGSIVAKFGSLMNAPSILSKVLSKTNMALGTIIENNKKIITLSQAKRGLDPANSTQQQIWAYIDKTQVKLTSKYYLQSSQLQQIQHSYKVIQTLDKLPVNNLLNLDDNKDYRGDFRLYYYTGDNPDQPEFVIGIDQLFTDNDVITNLIANYEITNLMAQELATIQDAYKLNESSVVNYINYKLTPAQKLQFFDDLILAKTGNIRIDKDREFFIDNLIYLDEFYVEAWSSISNLTPRLRADFQFVSHIRALNQYISNPIPFFDKESLMTKLFNSYPAKIASECIAKIHSIDNQASMNINNNNLAKFKTAVHKEEHFFRYSSGGENNWQNSFIPYRYYILMQVIANPARAWDMIDNNIPVESSYSDFMELFEHQNPENSKCLNCELRRAKTFEKYMSASNADKWTDLSPQIIPNSDDSYMPSNIMVRMSGIEIKFDYVAKHTDGKVYFYNTALLPEEFIANHLNTWEKDISLDDHYMSQEGVSADYRYVSKIESAFSSKKIILIQNTLEIMRNGGSTPIEFQVSQHNSLQLSTIGIDINMDNELGSFQRMDNLTFGGFYLITGQDPSRPYIFKIKQY